MSDSETLLDTPKKRDVQLELGKLRADLKIFERNFTEAHGKKPKQNDIKNDRSVAAKYKRYHRLQDILAGKLRLEELVGKPVHKKSRKEEMLHGTLEHGLQNQSSEMRTPRRSRKPLESDILSFTSPKPILSDAIGPTPHRDGKVLGLFDLLERSGSAKTSASPSSSARKRRIEELYSDTPVQRSRLRCIQPQSKRSNKKDGDLLEFLTGTPEKSEIGYDRIRHSRTPRSDCRKFALSQLFATPSTQRFLHGAENEATKNTPLRCLVLGTTPQKDVDAMGLDATPTYLRRSTSFKDRLMSAASSPALKESRKPVSGFRQIGPPTLRHFRSSTSNTLVQSDVQHDIQKANEQEIDDTDGHEDDWAALRELDQEASGQNILVEDSQLDEGFTATLYAKTEAHDANTSKYKKKGQKRTTKKSNIKPAIQKAADAPRFIAADDSENDDNCEDTEELDESMIVPHSKQISVPGDSSETRNLQRTKKPRGATKFDEIRNVDPSKKKSHGTINPNAQSHMNFRSLKIKNKNTKAKGFGRSKFARGRR